MQHQFNTLLDRIQHDKNVEFFDWWLLLGHSVVVCSDDLTQLLKASTGPCGPRVSQPALQMSVSKLDMEIGRKRDRSMWQQCDVV